MAKHSPFRRRFDRLIGHRLEAAALALFTGLVRRLPLDTASALGGWIGRTMGPWIGGGAHSLRNIQRSFPDLPAAAHRRILREAWDNFGRTLAEYVHLPTLKREWDQRVEMIGGEHLAALAGDGRPGITITGHLGNWELAALACHLHGLELTFVFRRPNNPYAARRLAAARAVLGGTMVPKGKQAARGLMTAMRSGGHVGLLVDQKLNQGIPVPFLGRDAMTGTVMADLALKFDAPVVPIRVTRLGGARFRVEAFPPLPLVRTGSPQADVAAAMGRVNALLEDWVREAPGQWHWQHRRWPD